MPRDLGVKGAMKDRIQYQLVYVYEDCQQDQLKTSKAHNPRDMVSLIMGDQSSNKESQNSSSIKANLSIVSQSDSKGEETEESEENIFQSISSTSEESSIDTPLSVKKSHTRNLNKESTMIRSQSKAMSEHSGMATHNAYSDLPGYNGSIIKVRLVNLTQKFLQGLDLINSGI